MVGLPYIARASQGGASDISGLKPGEAPTNDELDIDNLFSGPDEEQQAMSFDERLEQMGNVKHYLRKRGYVRGM